MFYSTRFKKVLLVSVGRKLIQVPLSMLWAMSSPANFAELLKVPISILHWLKIQIIVHLDDMLLMSKMLEEFFMAQHTLIFLLQHLGFVVNAKKSILSAVQEIEFLGLQINSLTMTFTLQEE